MFRIAVSAIVRWHCLAFGRVQGVNYRARVVEAADRRGLAGRVTNLLDGSVLIDVQGPEEIVEEFLREVSGPRGLSDARRLQRVAAVPISPGLVGFEIGRG